MTTAKKEIKDSAEKLKAALEEAALGDSASKAQLKTLLRVGGQKSQPLTSGQVAVVGQFLSDLLEKFWLVDHHLDVAKDSLKHGKINASEFALRSLPLENNLEELRGGARLALLAIIQNHAQLGADAAESMAKWLTPEIIEQIGLPTLKPEGEKHKERQVIAAGHHYGYWESMFKSQDPKVVGAALNIVMQLAVQGHEVPSGLIAMAEQQKIKTSFQKSRFSPDDYAGYRESPLQQENFKWDLVFRALTRSQELSTMPFKTSTLDPRHTGINYLTGSETAKEITKIFQDIHQAHPYRTMVEKHLQVLHRRITGENSDFLTKAPDQKAKPVSAAQAYQGVGFMGTRTPAAAAAQEKLKLDEQLPSSSAPKPSGDS